MTDTTFEQAKRCPKCDTPGDDAVQHDAPRQAGLRPGTKIHQIYCRNEGCRWYNTCWSVQVNPDGSIPAPKNHKGSPKLYGGIEGHDEMAKNLIDTLKRNAQRETEGDAEIQRPR